MARLPRLFLEGVPSHVIVRGNNRQNVFVSDGDRVYFHRCLVDLSRQADVQVHAYVLMSNHVHLLATSRHRAALSRMIQRLGRRYVGYFNYLHERSGTLWEGRFKSTLVQTERYFLTCQRYIELNPVRAGMVSHPGGFPWSSYRCNADNVGDDLVSPHEMYEALARDPIARQAAYRELFKYDLDAATLAKIRDSIQNGWALGSDEFCQQVLAKAGRRPVRARRGRSRKLEVSFAGV